MKDAGKEFAGLVELMVYMRGPDGCSWDKEQGIRDFAVHVANESEEVVAAIKAGDHENLREELGDLLWNIVFLSQIAREEGLFDIIDVMEDVREKIVRRHPHVFGDEKITDPDEIITQWHKIKAEEKKRK